ncbi:phospholipase C type enzyme [Ophidiomyces ophidiicola]|uniref:Phospholipase C type enzyme n=1 Tax=Ophidiomyces ophidiicola TaxID=1387563 RepID=A0ACB8UQQ6_9EURO|nr:phospholipase C type enzyme [Ophidiomyces ophidiicola]KAI1921543.1 phospholipase C type enzyme [Ophidiomyces ophidiicola]KAI1944398.1 phospholipase C type enzyme [Ophidiomyces ophidiicola]KAI1948989.1 phospholipase C type enzyme [Ophidiomyces ophidiicola]KAI1958688.1 phospholipase C type enzyme [Ophidiomyces ophidiicola]KAI1970187.1 phospholipase C type enzyme [Ophidiomyces ophidiicola]
MFSSYADDDIPRRINILSLNCWGLKFISKHRRERLLEIGKRLASLDYPPEIVGLQECWTQEDYNNIRKETRHILPYGKFYFSGVFGGGLAILSKWPIEESSMFAYPLNGRPTAFFRGDWFVGKGVACARIRIGPEPKDIAAVFCTHLHAPYEREPHDSYICHRTAQAWEIAKLMRAAAEKGHLVIGLGDFNMLPLSLAHRLITTHAPVEDVWRYLHPDSSIGAAVDQVEMARGKPIPSADYNLSENGATCDGPFNTWRWDKAKQKRLLKDDHIEVDGRLPDPLGKRLDYIFVGDGGAHSQSSASCPSTLSSTPLSHWKWTIESTRLGMTERHPTLRCSLSDHFSVEAVISRDIPEAETSSQDEGAPFLPIQKQEAPYPQTSSVSATLNPSSAKLPKPVTPAASTADMYDEILKMIHTYKLRERFQRRMRLGHFCASLCVAICCLVGIWWSARAYVSFILCLLSTLSLTAGVIDGLIGGLFVSSELRALKEFEWEVINAKKLALGMGLDIEQDLG